MSRTRRTSELNWRNNGDRWHYRSSPFRDFQNTQVEAHDGYVPRARHRCTTYPHLISTYDDVAPSALRDKWASGYRPN